MSIKGTADDRRSQKTRKALRSALEDFLGARQLSAISVTALAERADINRATFYLHYEGTSDVLLDVAER